MLYVPGGAPALNAPRSYGSKPITAQSYEGNTTVTGTPSPDNPATLTPVEPPEVLGAAKQIGPLWSLPDGTKDTYDGETGVLVRRVGRLVLGGTSNIGKAGIGINAYRIATAPTIPATVPAADSIANIYCDRMVFTSVDTSKITDSYGISIASNSQASLADGVIRFTLPISIANTADGAKSWLSTHPITVLFELSKPVVEHIAYTGPIATRATDILAPSWTGKTTVTGEPSPDNPATITGVPFVATATGPNGESRSVDLGFTGYSLPDGTADTYDGETGAFVQRVGKLVLDGTENWNTGGEFYYLKVQDAKPINNIYQTHFATYPSVSIIGKGMINSNGMYCVNYDNNVGDIENFKSFLATNSAAGTPVTVIYELAEPIAYNRKADMQAFEGQTTVTGADSVEVIEGRVLRVADCLPFEVVRVNPNLADNPFFQINQREQTQYTSQRQCVDRFTIAADIGNPTLTVESDGVLLQGTENTVFISQPYEASDFLPGLIYTFSAIKKYGEFISIEALDVTRNKVIEKKYIGDGNIIFVSFIAPEGDDINLILKTKTNTKIRCIKKELGPTQTLARKVGDQWVLNDPPPDLTLELLKCQRYYIPRIGNLCNGYVTGAVAQVFVPTPVTMRANPNVDIIFADNIVTPDGVYNVQSVTSATTYKNGVSLNIQTNRSADAGRTICITASTSLSFSAEL